MHKNRLQTSLSITSSSSEPQFDIECNLKFQKKPLSRTTLEQIIVSPLKNFL